MFEYSLGEGRPTFYIAVSWLTCLWCFGWFVYVYVRRRYLFIKPSILVLFYAHVFLQWPATIYSGFYEQYLIDPFDMLVLTGGFVLIGLAVSTRTYVVESKRIWRRITDVKMSSCTCRGALIVLFLITLTCSVVYFLKVPISKTGMYAILYDPVTASLVREESLKLVDSALVRYSYSIMSSAVAPLLAALFVIRAMSARAKRQYLMLFFCVAGIFFTIAAVSFPGQRFSIVRIMLVVILVSMFKQGLPFKPVHIGIASLVVLMPAVVLNIMRESKIPNLELLVEYFGYIFQRIIGTLEVGGYYIHVAQHQGLFGVGGIPKLAALLGETPIDLPNYIGLTYGHYVIDTTAANSGYMFVYYSVFGLASIIVTLLLLWMLDATLYIFDRLESGMLLAAVSTVAVIALTFIQSDFTTTLVTHGFVPALLLAYVLGKATTRNRLERRCSLSI